MSEVIEVMAAAMSENWAEGTDEELASDAIAALRAAEKAGWRLVPVEPTEQMREAWRELPHMECSFAEADWCQMIHAAPRPWDEVER
ncbi:MAG: hypothetical protein FKY71_09875 [Spiribacter salinus]|uniref:Uncharacterized protein n=1 Tax=Spiribacter salinus TaxID=1335746 RepID=A0A540VQY7_9GAMM|nr:MAG: hypothetical protein FKY71_09875 [Spiribacter salinus]